MITNRSKEVASAARARRLSDEELEEARRRRANGEKYTDIGRSFGMSGAAMRHHLTVKQRVEDANRLQAERAACVAARLAEIPPDTRTPAEIAMGDPIPGDARRHWCPWLQQ